MGVSDDLHPTSLHLFCSDVGHTNSKLVRGRGLAPLYVSLSTADTYTTD